jgi:mannan endo-1,4-beta-mannosidase
VTPRSTVRILTAMLAAALLAGCGSLLSAPSTSNNGQSAPSAPKAGTAAASPGPAYNVSGLLDPATGKYLGLEADGAPDSLTPVNTFAANIGRNPNMVGQYIAWGTPFDASAAANAWSYGAVYYLAWEPFSSSVQAIADGQSDAYITQFAQAVRTLNVPVALSFGHEMNGNWYPWGTAKTTPATFVAAWRHIHDLFTKADAGNVIWVWNPNIINPVPGTQLKPLYPGDSYVDWVGVTGYFPTTGPQTYTTLFAPTMTEIRDFTTKPFIIAETAIETGPAEVTCAENLIATVTGHSDVLGFVWFDIDKGGVDWKVESRPTVRAAMARDVATLKLVDPKRK